MAPEPSAFRFMVPEAEELPVMAIAPLAAVVSVKLPTVEAARPTALVSLTNALPVVLTASVSVLVRTAEPEAPILPEVEFKLTAGDMSVPDDQIMLPDPPAVNVTELLALKSESIVMLKFGSVATIIFGATMLRAPAVEKLPPTVSENVSPAETVLKETPDSSVI